MFSDIALSSTIRMSFSGDYRLSESDITVLDTVGLTEEISALLKYYDVSIQMEAPEASDFLPRDGIRETSRKPCKVTIKNKSSGSAHIGHKRLGADARGAHDRDITIEGPCDEIGELIKIILKEE